MAARELFVEDAIKHIEAGNQLVEGIKKFNEETTGAIADLDGGMTMTEAFTRHDSAVWSRRMNELLEAYEKTRRKVRESAATALQQEGRTAGFIAESFGTTRQWASRLLRGARAAENPGDSIT